jgi:hypothetical protein
MDGQNDKFAVAFPTGIKNYNSITLFLGNYVGDIFNSPACNSLDWKTNGDKILAACTDSKGYMV